MFDMFPKIVEMVFYTGIMLGTLIFIHELGHFLAAKLTGMRVDRFSIGFPPRAFGKKIGETDYCISWIPIGGYVKIAGMVDESFDTEFLEREPAEWEFRAKPMWARMLVLSAGVIMNVLLAIVIFWGVNYVDGKITRDTTEVGFVAERSPAASAGFAVGDRILFINGKQVSTWDDIERQIYLENLGNDISFEIERGGKRENLLVLQDSIRTSQGKSVGLGESHVSAVIKAVEAGMPAEKLGLKTGDTLLSVDSNPVGYPQQVLALMKSRAGRTVTLQWKRADAVQSGTATVTAEGRIGVAIDGIYTGPSRRVQYSLIEAFPEGIKKTGESVYLFCLTISKIIAGKTSVKESFGGPIAIAQLATQSAQFGILPFLEFMAVLSMSLAILNILPFPALDGGHLMMLLYEKIFHREIPNRVKIMIQQAGFILLLAFMAFVVYNDISRF